MGYKPTIIAISGHAQHGKDTIAKMLHGFMDDCVLLSHVAHFADLLKYICATFFGWDGVKDEHGRALLQQVGTDVIRKKNPNFWVDFIADLLQYIGEYWDYVIIPDARFPNEISRLRDAGFDVIHVRVNRPNFDSGLTPEQLAHPSETALDGVTPDYTIENNGTIDELNDKVVKWAKEVLNIDEGIYK